MAEERGRVDEEDGGMKEEKRSEKGEERKGIQNGGRIWREGGERAD